MNENIIVSPTDHISVCICTYKRPMLLARLLNELQNQVTNGLFEYSVVVVDNDSLQSAKSTVESAKQKLSISIDYHHEPEQNIALARNRAVENAQGNFIAFIDDDEYPEPTWLSNLYKTLKEFKVDGVLGPVKPHFAQEPPRWIIDGHICERPTYPTGSNLHWDVMRTGNVLIRRELFLDETHRFRREYGRSGGEDGDFFRRVCERGAKFVWCHEASVYETISEDRWSASFYLKRSVRIGGLNGERVVSDPYEIVKRLPKNWIWIIGLLLATPVTVFGKKHIRLRVLMKLAYEVGWAFGLFGCVFYRIREE